ncbi:MAG: Methyltransferase type 11 [Pedosphaera sp.]|nr:Methyltransferase type 11 [Pedosphaera sp.]
MNWAHLQKAPWLDTRAKFVAGTPTGGTLLDLGSSEGETLRHIAELRPDLQLFATDIAGYPERYPKNCQFHRGDLQREKLPWADASMSAITCMHLVEHLTDLTLLVQEVKRLLKPGGQVYFETPHPKSLTIASPKGKGAGTFTLNFYDDPTHVKPVAIGALAQLLRQDGLDIIKSGTSRNWIFAGSHLIYQFLPPSRQKYTARVHWLGWSACLVARRPQ